VVSVAEDRDELQRQAIVESHEFTISIPILHVAYRPTDRPVRQQAFVALPYPRSTSASISESVVPSALASLSA
jgi:hypothetical protein